MDSLPANGGNGRPADVAGLRGGQFEDLLAGAGGLTLPQGQGRSGTDPWTSRLQGQPAMLGMTGDGPLVPQLPFLQQDLFGQQAPILNFQPQQPQLPLMPPDLLNMAIDLAPQQQQPSQQQQQQPQQQQHQPSLHDPASTHRGAGLDKDAKQALARQKNREAQQRFRERQRIKLEEANVEFDKLSEEVERLRLENHALAKQNGIMEKVLTVRDAMMRAFDEFKSVTTPQQLCGMEGQSAEGLMQAIENLPTQEDMDQFASSSEASRSQQRLQQRGLDGAAAVAETSRSTSPGRQQGASGGEDSQHRWQGAGRQGDSDVSQCRGSGLGTGSMSGSGVVGGGGGGDGRRTRSPSPDDLPQCPAGPIWAGIRNASASGVEIDGSVLGRAGSIPPPTNKVVVRRVQQMVQPQDFVDYWTQWQMDVVRVCESAKVDGWTQQHLEEADEVMTDVIQMWWHAAQLRPGYMVHLIERGTRKNACAEDEVSRAIAGHIGPHLDEESRRLMRRAWQQYMRRLARAAIGVSRWVQRLQVMAAPAQVESMRSVASGAIEIMEITRHMRIAVEEEYLASMEFLANLTPALTQRQKLEINYLAMPYLPDWVSVTYHILKQDAAAGAPGGAALAMTLPPAVSAPVRYALPIAAGAQHPQQQQQQAAAAGGGGGVAAMPPQLQVQPPAAGQQQQRR